MAKAAVVMDNNQKNGGLLESSTALKNFKLERFVRDLQIDSISVESIDLLIHLGSDLTLVNGLTTDFMRTEAKVMTAAIQRGLPVFGICFGAQLMSLVLGGQVTRMPIPEIGWTSVSSSREFSGFDGEWFQWHYDTFSLPPGAVRLAENSTCLQSFRKGRCLATQFHPELDMLTLNNWLNGGGDDELMALGISPSKIVVETESQLGGARARFDEVLTWYLSTN